MPIQSKVNFTRWPLLHLGAVLIMAAFGLAGQALAQEAAAHDRIFVVTHADIIPPQTAAGTKLVQQYVADTRKDQGLPAFLRVVYIGKNAGETPAPQRTCARC